MGCCSVLLFNSALSVADSTPSLLWQDEFNATELNPNNWRYHQPGNRFQGFNDESAVDLVDGALRITTQARNGAIFTGMISTKSKKEIKTGYLEISAKFPLAKSGMKCSAILQSPLFGNKDIDENLSPVNTGSVVTLMQFPNRNNLRMYGGVTWGDYGDNTERDGSYAEVDLYDGKFHTIGVDLQEDRYDFYIDDNLYLSTSSGISGIGMFVVLSCEVKASLGVFDHTD